jgi:hypothetical protein
MVTQDGAGIPARGSSGGAIGVVGCAARFALTFRTEAGEPTMSMIAHVRTAIPVSAAIPPDVLSLSHSSRIEMVAGVVDPYAR